MKRFLTSIYVAWLAFLDYQFREVIMNIPFHNVRLFFINRTIARTGTGDFFALGIEFRKGRNIFIGDYSIINKKTLLDGRGGKLRIGNNVDIAQEVNIWTLTHDPHSDNHITEGADVNIEDYAWIGARATILPGVTIGRGAVVGTGSVVTKSVAPMTIVAGIPAREIGERKSKLDYTLHHQPWFR